DAATVVDKHGPLPVIFLRRHELYPAVVLRADLAPSMAQLCFDVPTEADLTASFRYEQQMGRRVHTFYEQFKVAEFSQLQRMRQFFVVVPFEAGADMNAIFPGARIRQHGVDLFEVILPDQPTSKAGSRS